MLLSKPQKFLLEILRKFGCLRREQANLLIRMEFPGITTEPVIHQLVICGMIRQENGIITELARAPDETLLSSIDIMLLIESVHIPLYQKAEYPFTLTFFRERGEKLWRYDICPVKSGTEIAIASVLERINPKFRVIVFVLEREDQKDHLTAPCEHCFVLKQNSEYHFYKPTDRKE